LSRGDRRAADARNMVIVACGREPPIPHQMPWSRQPGVDVERLMTFQPVPMSGNPARSKVANLAPGTGLEINRSRQQYPGLVQTTSGVPTRDTWAVPQGSLLRRISAAELVHVFTKARSSLAVFRMKDFLL